MNVPVSPSLAQQRETAPDCQSNADATPEIAPGSLLLRVCAISPPPDAPEREKHAQPPAPLDSAASAAAAAEEKAQCERFVKALLCAKTKSSNRPGETGK